MGEIRKVYNESFEYLGYKKDRQAPLDGNEYILVTGCFVISQGKLLVTKRAEEKSYAHEWEFTMGSVVDDESSLEGAIRELEEEVGILAREEELKYLGFRKEDQKFAEIYLLEKEVEKISLQVEEVEDYQFIDKKQLDQMLDSHDFARPMEERILDYYDSVIEKLL